MVRCHAPPMTSATELTGWQGLLDAQHGIVTAAQLHQLGHSRSSLRHLVESGQWLRVLRGVFAVMNGPLTRPMLLSAALCYGGHSAILSHRTAAEEWAMMRCSNEPLPVHITVPEGKSAMNQPPILRRSTPRPVHSSAALVHPGVVVHRSRAIRHIRVDSPQPRTTKAATALDLAVDEPTEQQATATFADAVINGRIPIHAIREHLDLRTPRRYREPLKSTVELLASGVQSMLEYRYAIDVEEAHGLPSGTRQRPVSVDGHTLFEDVDYSDTGVPLIVRLDGQLYHSIGAVPFRDRRRDNAAELAGRPRLMFGWDETSNDPCGVSREVRAVLVREGWPDMSHPCRNCS